MGGPGSGPQAPSVLSADELPDNAANIVIEGNPSDLPAWFAALPPRPQGIMLFCGMGYNDTQIARVLKCSRENVTQIRRRYDPEGVFRLPPVLRERVALARLASLRDGYTDQACDTMSQLTPMQTVVALGIVQDKLRDAQKLAQDAHVAEVASGLSRQLAARFGPAALPPANDPESPSA